MSSTINESPNMSSCIHTEEEQAPDAMQQALVDTTTATTSQLLPEPPAMALMDEGAIPPHTDNEPSMKETPSSSPRLSPEQRLQKFLGNRLSNELSSLRHEEQQKLHLAYSLHSKATEVENASMECSKHQSTLGMCKKYSQMKLSSNQAKSLKREQSKE